jgi:hypothetical protein
MITVADSDLPTTSLALRAVRAAAGKLMTAPIIASPAPDGWPPQLDASAI